jgi:predicted NodU family carbamoyl transferase
MNILSVHYGHDSSACILQDGEISFYFKEEVLYQMKLPNSSDNKFTLFVKNIIIETS